MEKGRNEFLANAVTIPGAGTCLQFQMNDASGPSQIYRDDEEFAKTANDKREELIARGWGGVPKLAPENG
jgi:hypothetical protein